MDEITCDLYPDVAHIQYRHIQFCGHVSVLRKTQLEKPLQVPLALALNKKYSQNRHF